MSDAEFILSEIDRRRRRSWVSRSLLGLLSVTQLTLAAPWLFGSVGLWTTGSATSAHLTRDGALGIMFGLAGVIVAMDTSKAWFAMPVVLVLTMVQTFFGVFDHHHDDAYLSFEIVHLIGVAITIFIAVFVQPRKRKVKTLRAIK